MTDPTTTTPDHDNAHAHAVGCHENPHHHHEDCECWCHNTDDTAGITIERPNDETIEIHVNGVAVATANHDEHGWSGMDAVERTALAVGRVLATRITTVRAELEQARTSLPATTQDYWHWRHRAEQVELELAEARQTIGTLKQMATEAAQIAGDIADGKLVNNLGTPRRQGAPNAIAADRDRLHAQLASIRQLYTDHADGPPISGDWLMSQLRELTADQPQAPASVPSPRAQVAVACVAGPKRPAADIRGDIPPARVLAALEVLGWPDDRTASAHVEGDGWEVTGVGHYWAFVEDVIRAADVAGRPAPVGPSQGQEIPEGQVAALLAALPMPAGRWSPLQAEMLREAARSAYRVGFAAALGCPITVAPGGDRLEIGDRPTLRIVDGRRERWLLDGLVGGWVCAELDPAGPDGECGMPVEDVPCTVHHPGAEDQADAVTALATALDRLGARWHRDLDPESSYLDPHDGEAVAAALSGMAAYWAKQVTVLDHPAVKRAMGHAEDQPTEQPTFPGDHLVWSTTGPAAHVAAQARTALDQMGREFGDRVVWLRAQLASVPTEQPGSAS